MSKQIIFPSLEGFEPTRQTLQLYSRAVCAIPRAYADFNPNWYHISLNVVPDGLISDTIVLPHGGYIFLKMDLARHHIELYRNDSVTNTWSMTEGTSATELGNSLIAVVETLGLTGGDYARGKFDNEEPRLYEKETVAPFLMALSNAQRIFQDHRDSLDGESGPLNFWSHGFDLAFEWFGTLVETYIEDGEPKSSPAQLNLGFYPGDAGNAPYLYSNPWPFKAEQLVDHALPADASWHTEGWQGTYLPYIALQDDAAAETRLRAFARTVFDIASPTLMA